MLHKGYKAGKVSVPLAIMSDRLSIQGHEFMPLSLWE